MSESPAGRDRDITGDLLLCNRCGKCRSVCPLYDVLREEWGGARGKVELAEAFFRGEIEDTEDLLKAFDLCLQCMTCEENCPSGMRAEEVVMAVRSEMARRGMIPWYKRMALHILNGMDSAAFKLMRAIGFRRKETLHGSVKRSPFGFLFPLFGWRRERVIPLPHSRPFLGNHPESFKADRAGFDAGATGRLDTELYRLAVAARRRNLEEGKTAYYFIGHTVNHFFPEEAEDLIWLLNFLGVDVIVPAGQECCGAPQFYAGDISTARKIARDVISGFERYEYDWIVTSCSSGGRMLRHEFPRLLDTGGDGFFKVEWDPADEVFVRAEDRGEIAPEIAETRERYKALVEGRVMDINELLAEMLGLEKESTGFDSLAEGEPEVVREGSGTAGRTGASGRPVVTFHHPCHLNRGQGVAWQPEALLELIPEYDYVPMPDADRCCGGGGSFTFTHNDISEKVADRKADSIAIVQPDVVATSCPVCRIQLVDTIHRRFVVEAEKRGDEGKNIPVTSPVELMAASLRKWLSGE